MNTKLVAAILLIVLLVGLAICVMRTTSREVATAGENGDRAQKLKELPNDAGVSKQTIKLKGGEVKILTITNIADILGCRKSTGSQTVEVKLSRNQNHEVVARVWSNRGEEELSVNGFEDIGRSKHPISAETGVVPGHPNAGDYGEFGIIVMAMKRPNEGPNPHIS